MYQISSKQGTRHAIEADMPGNDAALEMWRGRNLPVTRCGRQLRPVNFYRANERSLPRYRCSRCFPDNYESE